MALAAGDQRDVIDLRLSVEFDIIEGRYWKAVMRLTALLIPLRRLTFQIVRTMLPNLAASFILALIIFVRLLQMNFFSATKLRC